MYIYAGLHPRWIRQRFRSRAIYMHIYIYMNKYATRQRLRARAIHMHIYMYMHICRYAPWTDTATIQIKGYEQALDSLQTNSTANVEGGKPKAVIIADSFMAK